MLYFFVYIRYLYNVQVIFCILTGWLTSVSWRRIHSNTIPLLHLIEFWYYARLIFIHKSTTRKNREKLKLKYFIWKRYLKFDSKWFRNNDNQYVLFFWFLQFIFNTIYLTESRFQSYIWYTWNMTLLFGAFFFIILINTYNNCL